MDPGLSLSMREGVGDQVRLAVTVPPRVRPLIRPAPRSAMFFPLVVLVATLPGLVALNSWDLSPPGPLWGLRALAVLDGMAVDQVPAAAEIRPEGESTALRVVAFQPPLYAWLAAVGMELSGDFDPLASVLPSYVAGALVVILGYLHGRLWRGGGLGFAAALLIGFNPDLLLRVQEATPITLALAGVLGALLCYGWHERVVNESVTSWAGPRLWAAAGGLALGLSLLALGGLGLVVIPIVILHQLYLHAGSTAPRNGRTRARAWWLDWRQAGWPLDGLIALAVAAAVALPWYLFMIQVHGWEVWTYGLQYRTLGVSGDSAGLLSRLIDLVPVTLPLGLYGAWRAIRLALTDEDNSPEAVGPAFWVIWLGVGALLPSVWIGGPLASMELFLLVPLSLLAALTVADLVNRRLPVRTLIWLAPATAFSVAWWASEDLRGALDDLVHGRADAATALGLHVALDLILVSVWFTRRLDRWARHRDDRQRQILAAFLLSILALTVAAGVREVVFRHSETHDLLTLRTMILRRNRERPFEVLAVLGPQPGRALRLASASPPTASLSPSSSIAPVPSSPAPTQPGSVQNYSGGWLRFVLRTALPQVPQRDISSVDELLALPEGQRLVILAGSTQGLSSAVKARLGLEAIHPGRSGILDAYATAHGRPPRR